MSIDSFLTHHKRFQTQNFQIFTPSSLPNSYCKTDRKTVPKQNTAAKKMHGQNIHVKTSQLKTNQSLDKPLQHLQRRETARLTSTRFAIIDPQQMKIILCQKRPQQKDSRKRHASIARIWVLLPSSGGRGFSPAPALCCAVPSGAGDSCHVSVLPAEAKTHSCAHNTQHGKSCSLATWVTTSASDQRKFDFSQERWSTWQISLSLSALICCSISS